MLGYIRFHTFCTRDASLRHFGYQYFSIEEFFLFNRYFCDFKGQHNKILVYKKPPTLQLPIMNEESNVYIRRTSGLTEN